jgi:hypothetical protein
MRSLRSAHFTMSGSFTLDLPPALVQRLRAEAQSGSGFQPGTGLFPRAMMLGPSTTVDFTASGVAQRPDNLSASFHVVVGGLTVNTELVHLNGHTYYRDPMSGAWKLAPSHHAAGSMPSPSTSESPLSMSTVLSTAKSVTKVGSGTISGVSVDEYQVVPDLSTLFTQFLAAHQKAGWSGYSAAYTPGMQQLITAIQQALSKASVSADIWIGDSDHLVRRVVYTANATVDLHQLAAVFPHTAASGASAIPAGSIATLRADLRIDLSGFNQPVTIRAPSVPAAQG